MKQEISLKFDTYSDNLGGYDPEDSWSRDSYAYSWDFRGIVKGNSYPSTSINDYKPDEKIYVIYAIYSTGDSFGHDPDANCEVIGATHNSELAYKIKEFIHKDCTNKDTEYNYDLHDIEGIKFHTYPWKGYFESLSYVRVEECQPLG